MKLGIIGLGRMGLGIAKRVLAAHHEVVGFDISQENKTQAQQYTIMLVDSLQELSQSCRIIWLMVPPGKPVDDVLGVITAHAQKDTIIIDGGNSNYQDSMRRAHTCAQKNISYLDCGTSGGLQGAIDGYCLMVGGEQKIYDHVLPLLQAIAIPQGVSRVGPSGAGHYVKMVHNGIEYALLQGYAEGFQVLKEGMFKDANLDLAKISELWNHGSIIRSYILELAHRVFEKDQKLHTISGEIAEGGTGAWTVQEAQKMRIPVPTIEASLQVRAQSRNNGGNFATKVVAMLRNAFGGHSVKQL